MKRNAKSKLYETMMDIICDFLILQRDATGGVDVPSQFTETTTTASSSATLAEPKRTGSVMSKKTAPTIPPSTAAIVSKT
jgi:hypothetical protein